MRSRSKVAATLIAFSLLGCVAVFAGKPDEDALLKLWEMQKNDPDNYAAIIQAADAFQQGFTQSPLIPVARGLSAWHQLKAGKIQEAQRNFGILALGGATPLAASGREMAFCWLTRLDRESVKDGLRKVFAENIEYPDTLAPLGNFPENLRPPMADRWGAPWSYRASDFKKIKAGAKSTFVLQSTKLGEMSDFKKAIASPYGGGEHWRLTNMSAQGGKALLKVSGTGGSQTLVGEGSTAGKLSFPYRGDAIIILSNGDYWFVEPLPAK